MYETVQHL